MSNTQIVKIVRTVKSFSIFRVSSRLQREKEELIKRLRGQKSCLSSKFLFSFSSSFFLSLIRERDTNSKKKIASFDSTKTVEEQISFFYFFTEFDFSILKLKLRYTQIEAAKYEKFKRLNERKKE